MNSDIHDISEGQIHDFIGSHSVDLLAGCPPCQGFSMKVDNTGKENTPYSLLQFVRLIDTLLPRMFLISDVPVFFGKGGRDFTQEFVRSLEALGYAVNWRKINAAEYGVPQIRRRLYYYGWRKSELPEFAFPQQDHPESFLTVEEAIGDLPSPYTETSELQSDPLHRLLNTSELNLKRLKYVRPGKGYQDIPEGLWPPHRHNNGYRFGRNDVYGRLHPEKPSGAIIAGFDSFTRGKFGHPYENRNITLREGARLQTFPDDFIFSGNQRDITRLIGNTAPPLLVEKIACAIAIHLKGDVKNPSLLNQHFISDGLQWTPSKRRMDKSSSGQTLSNNKTTGALIKTRHEATELPNALKTSTNLRSSGKKRKSKHQALPLLEEMQSSLIIDSVKGSDFTSVGVVMATQVEHEIGRTQQWTTSPNRVSQNSESCARESQANPLLRVFLCHSSKDKPIVRTLYHRLREDGVSPWLDEEDLLPGQKWEVEIPRAVQCSDAVIVCLSQGSTNKRGYVQKEIKYALDVADEQPEGTIFLIPLRLEECNVPGSLSNIQWVNLFEDKGYERLMRALKARSSTL
jgi:DNA (cytosine-5)-methyltransferase 1